MKLSGRTAVVTGASRGIGRAVAASLLEEGVRVVAVSRDEDRLLAAAEELAAGSQPAPEATQGAEASRPADAPQATDGAPLRVRAGEQLVTVAADVGDPGQVRALFDRVSEVFERLDFLVNAAGILRRSPIEETSFEEWQESLRVNLTGVFLCSQAAARLMLAQPTRSGGIRGHVVQIVSGSGVHGWAGAGAYTASKFGVMGLSEVLRDELRERGIKVTTVLPGMVDTDMTSHPDFGGRHKLDPTDVAQAVLAVLGSSPQAMLTRVDVRHRLPL